MLLYLGIVGFTAAAGLAWNSFMLRQSAFYFEDKQRRSPSP